MLNVIVRYRGFSLVELVLTISLIGILAAVVGPRFFNQSTFEERFFYEDLLSASRYASKLAVSSGCSVRLTVNASGFQLALDSNCDLSAPSYSLTVPRPDDGEAFANTAVPSGVSITTTDANLIFRPDHQVINGSGSSITSATIQLVGQSSRQIRIYGTTGYVVGS